MGSKLPCSAEHPNHFVGVNLEGGALKKQHFLRKKRFLYWSQTEKVRSKFGMGKNKNRQDGGTDGVAAGDRDSL